MTHCAERIAVPRIKGAETSSLGVRECIASRSGVSRLPKLKPAMTPFNHVRPGRCTFGRNTLAAIQPVPSNPCCWVFGAAPNEGRLASYSDRAHPVGQMRATASRGLDAALFRLTLCLRGIALVVGIHPHGIRAAGGSTIARLRTGPRLCA